MSKDIKEVGDKMVEDINSIFDDDTTIPESAWFNFEKVGDTIAGELIETFENEGKYGMQQVYVVKTAEGKEFNVALKHTTHKVAVQQLKSAEPGDIIGFKFEKEIPTDYGNAAKAITVRIRRVNKK